MDLGPKVMGHQFCAALFLLTLASAELRLPGASSWTATGGTAWFPSDAFADQVTSVGFVLAASLGM